MNADIAAATLMQWASTGLLTTQYPAEACNVVATVVRSTLERLGVPTTPPCAWGAGSDACQFYHYGACRH